MITAAKHNKNYQEVAQQLNVESKLVKEINESIYQFIKTKIKEIPFLEINSEEEFRKYKTSFTLPKLGTLYVDYNQLIKINNNVRNKREKDNSDVHRSSNNNG